LAGLIHFAFYEKRLFKRLNFCLTSLSRWLTSSGWRAVLEFLIDQQVLSSLAALLGPLCFFAAPTSEIETLLRADATPEATTTDAPVSAPSLPESLAA
jgi:hypothetical protein